MTTTTLMTIEEFLALPDDGVDRELIRGELREKGMTVRNRYHSHAVVNACYLLKAYAIAHPQLGWKVLGGEAGFILDRETETTVGVDVAVISAETLRSQFNKKTSLVDGVPVLAVEVLSPSDTHEAIHEKTDLYLEHGVALVWLVDTDDKTVKVYRPGRPPELFNCDQELDGESVLPGFRAPVAAFFD